MPLLWCCSTLSSSQLLRPKQSVQTQCFIVQILRHACPQYSRKYAVLYSFLEPVLTIVHEATAKLCLQRRWPAFTQWTQQQ